MIEQTIVSSLYDAAGSGTPADQPNLLRALAQTRPLPVLMRKQVDALRVWAKGRCVVGTDTCSCAVVILPAARP